MNGFYEIRADGPKRQHHRLFCLLERDGAKVGLAGPSLVLLAEKDKAFQTVFSTNDYAEIRSLGREFIARTPRTTAITGSAWPIQARSRRAAFDTIAR